MRYERSTKFRALRRFFCACATVVLTSVAPCAYGEPPGTKGSDQASEGAAHSEEARLAVGPPEDPRRLLAVVPRCDTRASIDPLLTVCTAADEHRSWPLPSPVFSQTQVGNSAKAPSTYDRVWKFAKWYENSSNPVIESVLFSGRFQYEYVALDADEGSFWDWNVRRMRLGPKITFLRSLTFHTEFELNPQEHDPFYVRLTDAYVQWNRSSAFNLTVGKQGVLFTMDGSTSSKELLTIDRSNLSNNIWFPQEYIPGVGISGKHSRWIYRGGLYSAGAMNREFGEFTGSMFTLGVVGYDFASPLGVKEALLAGNYVYQDPDPDNTFTRQLQHVFSVNFRLEDQRWGVRADVSGAAGYLGQSDLWAVMAMPFFNLSGKLQLVGRYTFIESDDPNGVRLATYENQVVAGRGDRYNEVYAGANYFFYGHKLKLQTGVQFADMRDRASDGGVYSGVSWTTGVRVGW